MSHARITAVTSMIKNGAGKVPGLLAVLALVPDPPKPRGRRYPLVFVLDVQVKLFAAMLHTEKTVIAQHRIPDDTTETTQVRELLEHMELDGAVVTADTASAQRDTAAYIAGNEEDGGRGSAYVLFVKGNQPKLQRAVFGAVQAGCPRDPDYTELDAGHGRIIRRSIWVTDAENIDFPHVRQAVTSLSQDQASPADLAKFARGQRGIESVHWLRDTAYDEDANTGYAGNGPQAVATTCRHETHISNDFGEPVPSATAN